MAVVLSGLVLAVLLLWIRHRQRIIDGKTTIPFFRWGSRAPSRAAAAAAPGAKSRSGALAIQQIAAYTHNRATAARLLDATRQANPRQSLAWCVDKTIADLIRDRR